MLETTGTFHRIDIWTIRAVGFVRYGLPLPTVNDEWRTFWDRFKFRPKVDLFWGDSNSLAWNKRVTKDVTEVWLFDAHHDAGYHGAETLDHLIKSQEVTCDNWMLAYQYALGAELHVRYPRWKAWAMKAEPKPATPRLDRRVDNGKPRPEVFDRIFVCQSQAWVPPWVDKEFTQFLDLCPAQRKVRLDDYAGYRGFAIEEAEKHALKDIVMMRQTEKFKPGEGEDNLQVVAEWNALLAKIDAMSPQEVRDAITGAQGEVEQWDASLGRILGGVERT
jgi:hypothetical protein